MKLETKLKKLRSMRAAINRGVRDIHLSAINSKADVQLADLMRSYWSFVKRHDLHIYASKRPRLEGSSDFTKRSTKSEVK